MGAGKVLSILASGLTFFATFLLSLAAINDSGTVYYVWGIGMTKNIMNMFTDAESLGNSLGIPFFVIYIIAFVIIWFLISCVLQLIGAKKRVAAILGSIVPILISCMALYYSFTAIPIDWIINLFGDRFPPLEGIVPFHYALPGRPEGIGIYILLGGGILGFIGGILPREQKYQY